MNIFNNKKLTLLRRISNLESKLSCFFTKLICFKSLIATVLTFVIFMALVQPLLLTARERRGSTVVVTMTDGRQVTGELLSVKADALLVYDQNTGQGKSLDLRQAVQVKILKKSKILQGLAIGLGAGLAISFFRHNISYIDHDGLSYLIFPPATTLLGFILGLADSLPKNIAMAGAFSEDEQQTLKRLKRYAREQE